MPNLREITDVKILQDVVSHLEKTTVRQSEEIARLRAEVSRLRGQDVDPQMEMELLREQLATLQQKVYGSSSEKRPADRGPSQERTGAPRRGHGPRPQPDLPVEIVPHTMAEEDRVCPICQQTMVEMGEQAEESEEITVIGVEYKILQHRRQKYRCRCNEQVMTAPGPPKLIPGGRYSVDFAVHVAEQKYLDHLPLERQARAMGRAGLQLDSQTLWDQLEALATHLEPTYEALLGRALEADVVYADETQWPLVEGKKTSKWWTWCVVSDEVASYRMLSSRSKAAAKRMLDGYQGVVLTDGYAAYKDLERAGPGETIPIAYCWAHARRKFVEAEDAYPEQSEYALARIRELYEVEKEARIETDASTEPRAALLAARSRLRAERSKEIVEDLLEWAVEQRGAVLPRSKMGKAIAYMLKLWPGLTRFLGDPRIPLDNNAAERALRGVVVGRKNHYGSRSKRGTQVAALFYTLFETAKLSLVDPRAYVRTAALAAITKPGAVTLPSDLT
jgi:transposase